MATHRALLSRTLPSTTCNSVLLLLYLLLLLLQQTTSQITESYDIDYYHYQCCYECYARYTCCCYRKYQSKKTSAHPESYGSTLWV